MVKRIRKKSTPLIKKATASSLDSLIRVDMVVKPTNPTESNTLVFKGTFMSHSVFGKVMWRHIDMKGGANTETKLMENEIENMAFHGMSPCFALRFQSVTIGARMFQSMGLFADMQEQMNREELSCRGVKLLLVEDCGDVTLSTYLGEEGGDEDAHAIMFMLFHALSYMRGYKISHNDLHGGNIMISKTVPTRMAFGEDRFLTSSAVRIIDWDLGRSENAPNESLDDYNTVGIFDDFNPLFDVVGLVKTFVYQRDFFTSPTCRARGVTFTRAFRTLQRLFAPLRRNHGWIFKVDHALDGDTKKTTQLVQQTIFAPNGTIEEGWPSKVFSDAPSIHAVTEALYDDMSSSRKQFKSAPTYSFPSTLLI